eukprot:GILK01009203.1.p1 GENE.GILK01009203.1~~GILK01009203.1.p1  ORF type:complete len:369 (+),score=26.25 GILK01009203.1:97-1107(+)
MQAVEGATKHRSLLVIPSDVITIMITFLDTHSVGHMLNTHRSITRLAENDHLWYAITFAKNQAITRLRKQWQLTPTPLNIPDNFLPLPSGLTKQSTWREICQHYCRIRWFAEEPVDYCSFQLGWEDMSLFLMEVSALFADPMNFSYPRQLSRREILHIYTLCLRLADKDDNSGEIYSRLNAWLNTMLSGRVKAFVQLMRNTTEPVHEERTVCFVRGTILQLKALQHVIRVCFSYLDRYFTKGLRLPTLDELIQLAICQHLLIPFREVLSEAGLSRDELFEHQSYLSIYESDDRVTPHNAREDADSAISQQWLTEFLSFVRRIQERPYLLLHFGHYP